MGKDGLVEVPQQGKLSPWKAELEVGQLVRGIILDLVDKDVADVALTVLPRN